MHTITEEEVHFEYLTPLGREPESPAIVKQQISNHNSVFDLIASIIRSEEFEFQNVFHYQLTIYNLFGIKMLVPDDDPYLREIRESNEYEPYVTGPFMEIIRPHHTVLDVGANVGCFSLLAAPRTKRVLAIDLSSVNCKIIMANAHLTGFKNIEVYPVAASDRVGVVTFRTTRGTHNSELYRVDVYQGNLDRVNIAFAAPLDAIVDHRRVDLVKIDIDGSEFLAMAPAVGLRAMRPHVFSEYAPQLLEKISHVDGPMYLDLFFNDGYQATILHQDLRLENVGQDKLLISQRWEEYMSNNITHLDLHLTPPE